jgi:transposase-like protein
MADRAASYHGYRFPPEIISHAVWLYHRFCVSFCDTDDLLGQRHHRVLRPTVVSDVRSCVRLWVANCKWATILTL